MPTGTKEKIREFSRDNTEINQILSILTLL
jgi:hypothetical protein